MRKIQAAAARHPQMVDAVFAVVLAGLLARVAAVDGAITGFGWVWFAAVHLPLVWRRRQPMIVFWTVIGVAAAAASLDYIMVSLLVVPLVAGYTLARHGRRRDLWPAWVPTIPFIAAWLWHGGSWWDALTLSMAFAAALLLGSNIQTRRAYLAELEQQRDQQARLAIAAERNRIAREMHDIVAHNLAVMVALADGAAATTPTQPQSGVDMMEKASAVGREALAEIRRLVGLLRYEEHGAPQVPQPGFDDLDELIRQVRATGLEVALNREGEPGAWGPGAGLAVYRIVQEALTNAMKHAGPQANVEVRLRYDATGAEVEVVDDGHASQAAPGTGHGLAGMIERAVAFGGRLDAGPRPVRGWRVRAHLPLSESRVP